MSEKKIYRNQKAFNDIQIARDNLASLNGEADVELLATSAEHSDTSVSDSPVQDLPVLLKSKKRLAKPKTKLKKIVKGSKHQIAGGRLVAQMEALLAARSVNTAKIMKLQVQQIAHTYGLTEFKEPTGAVTLKPRSAKAKSAKK